MLAAMASRRTIDELLAQARAGLDRASSRIRRATRSAAAPFIGQNRSVRQGVVPDAIWIARNVLEWRCDPSCEAHDDRIGHIEQRVIVMCDEGYQSSLAAATLQQLGFTRATDLAGGFQTR